MSEHVQSLIDELVKLKTQFSEHRHGESETPPSRTNLILFLSEYFKSTHAVNISTHKEYPNRLICLHYNQTRANFENAFTRLCRGVIVDLESQDDCGVKIVHMPFSKFFNFNEDLSLKYETPLIEKHFTESSVKVYEKLDGSIVNFYYFDSQWRVASSSTPDGCARLGFYSVSSDKEINDRHREKTQTFEFSQLVWDTFQNLNYSLPSEIYQGKYSFTFELTTPKHPLVVQHETDDLVLHGVRDLQTFTELDPEPFAKEFNWKVASCVKLRYVFKSLEDVERVANERDPYKHEGFVVCYQSYDSDSRDALDFVRVKVKSKEYVKISLSMFDSVEKRENSFIDIIRKNESSEFLSYFPQFKEAFELLKCHYLKIVKHLNDVQETVKTNINEMISTESINYDTIDESKKRSIHSQAISRAKQSQKLTKTECDIMFSIFNNGDTIQDILKTIPLKRYKSLNVHHASLSTSSQVDE
ncbi:hypothetical protein C9374_006299 [Naegleria lovaniensis]|uniref:T4 RNA ligase 1-like N-terminal domain-containing protein n=1 Tax=Naegleria lovaniensis TaxID=51637 RepID=A0AA88GJJ2_NAELO|nr:uncharacterized protein C9374_006299 [Naegleria lovaniensis]KAG2381310.1 hypothetical protein C9374_006299 [Naegleria lovaniensis]